MAFKPVDEIPVHKPKYNQDRLDAVRDLQHMAAQGIRRAEVIPEHAERWYKNPGGYSEKLNWAARHVRFHDSPGRGSRSATSATPSACRTGMSN